MFASFGHVIDFNHQHAVQLCLAKKWHCSELTRVSVFVCLCELHYAVETILQSSPSLSQRV